MTILQNLILKHSVLAENLKFKGGRNFRPPYLSHDVSYEYILQLFTYILTYNAFNLRNDSLRIYLPQTGIIASPTRFLSIH